MSLQELIKKRKCLKADLKQINQEIETHPDRIAKSLKKGKRLMKDLLKEVYDDKTERKQKERIINDTLIRYKKKN